MKNLRCIVFLGIVVGLALGIMLHSRLAKMRSADEVSADAAPSPSSETLLEVKVRSHGPRPTLADMLRAEGVEAIEILGGYLGEAKMPEILVLLHAKNEPGSSLKDMEDMIYIRGMEIDPEGMIEWSRDEVDETDLTANLYRWWCLLDPKAALGACLKNDPELKNRFLQWMDLGDAERGLAAVEELWPDAPGIEALEARKWDQSADDTIQTALSEAMVLSDSEDKVKALEAPLQAWADGDPWAALAWIQAQESFEGIGELLVMTINALGRKDPVLALTKSKELLPRGEGSELERAIVEEWARRDRDSVLSWISSEPKGQKRDHYFTGIANDLANDPEKFFDQMNDLEINPYHKQGEANNLSNAIFRAAKRLSKDSPEKAIRALYTLGGSRLGSIGMITDSWIDRDPHEAAEWAAALPESDFSKEIQDQVFQTWSRRSAKETAKFLQLNEMEVEPQLAHSIASNWIETDAEAAMDWMNHLEGEVKQKVISGAILNLSSSDPVLALRYIYEVKDYEQQQNLLERAVKAWRDTNPSEALAWLGIQPEEAGVDGIVMKTARDWVLKQPRQASQWIEAMENGLRRDQAIAGMVDALTFPGNPHTDFDAAEEWLRTIENRELQEEMSQQIDERR